MKEFIVYLLKDSRNSSVVKASTPEEALTRFSHDRPHGHLALRNLTFIDNLGTWSVRNK